MAHLASVILAAGQGTRMKSSRPKVLHEVCGTPMVLWSVQSARALGADSVVLVVGNGADAVRQTVGSQVTYVVQEERLGTGHAVMQAREELVGKADVVLVLYGDMPTLRMKTLERMVALHAQEQPAITMLTVRSEDSMGFGRVVRDATGEVKEVVEEAVATPEILALDELNCGVYCFDGEWLWAHIDEIPMSQPKGEYYLTDAVGLATAAGDCVKAVTITDVSEVQGVNTRVHLARAERIMRERTVERVMLSGVTVIDPATTYIDASVTIGRDTVIQPNTHLLGGSSIGEGCELGPNTVVVDSQIAGKCRVTASVVENSVMEEGSEVGPFGHLRSGAHLGPGVHMGNFGEVKNAYLGAGTKMGHVGYVGDAKVGPDVNIGAGTVTCNYDGQEKHRTQVEDGAFVGSGTMLVAPVTVGRGAIIGAGSVVTHDIPEDTVAYGVPARPKGEAPKHD